MGGNGHLTFCGSDRGAKGRERAIELLVENDDFYRRRR